MLSVPSLASKRPGTSRRHTPVVFYRLKRLTCLWNAGHHSRLFICRGRKPTRRLPNKGRLCLSTTCGLFRKAGRTMCDQSFTFSIARIGWVDRTRFTARRKQSWIESRPRTEGRVVAAWFR
jgi:hypothetical protein